MTYDILLPYSQIPNRQFRWLVRWSEQMGLKAGSRLRSRVSDAEFVVIKAAESDATLTSGGVITVELSSSAPRVEIIGDHDGEVILGKRYSDDSDTFEVLCTKPGSGALAIDERPLHLKSAKPLPSSD
jgi:hypothetical protein